MARSSQSTDVAITMLRDLVAAEALASSLAATAPLTVADAGGARALVAERGHRTGAWFWSVAPLPDARSALAASRMLRYQVPLTRTLRPFGYGFSIPSA